MAEICFEVVMSDINIIIPARLGSTRLPRKMVADVNGIPLIIRTLNSAKSANIGRVIVACDSEEIANLVKEAGGEAIITSPDLPSGTDRVYAAAIEAGVKNGIIVNIQGDVPFVDPIFIEESAKLCAMDGVDISTPIVKIEDDSYMVDSVVKPVVSFYSEKYAKALYFSRSKVPYGGPFYHHVGVYAYKFEALEKFVSLPASPLEKSEKLEQLRALENGISIHTVLCDVDTPISVDTEEDLKRAIAFGAKLCRNSQ